MWRLIRAVDLRRFRWRSGVDRPRVLHGGGEDGTRRISPGKQGRTRGLLGGLLRLCLLFGFRRFSAGFGRRGFDHKTLGDLVIGGIGLICSNVLMILLLDVRPEYVRGWGVKPAPAGRGGRRLGSEILCAFAGRVLEGEDGSIVGFLFFGLFEHGLIGVDVALVVSAPRHGVQDIQKRSGRGG